MENIIVLFDNTELENTSHYLVNKCNVTYDNVRELILNKAKELTTDIANGSKSIDTHIGNAVYIRIIGRIDNAYYVWLTASMGNELTLENDEENN